MKFVFKKIASVLASAVMLGSTIGIAAAANYPAPFVSGGASDVTIVAGAASPGLVDWAPAVAVSSDLADELAAQTLTTDGTTASGGDNKKIERSSDKFNLGNNANSVFVTSVDDTDLPTLLADGTYVNDENSEFDYTQEITLGSSVQLTHFSDSDYNDEEPTIGFKLADGTLVLNYTIDFTKQPESDVNAGGDLADFETTDLKILGKTYYILDADNSTMDLTLLDSADTQTITEGETISVSSGGKSYEVMIDFLSTTEVVLKVNGESTKSLAEGGTRKLSDGAYVGIKDIRARDVAGTTGSVEFSIGAGKLLLDNGAYIELNDEDVKGLTTYITRGTTTTKVKIDQIVIEWKVYDEEFITPNQSLEMPGFKALKLTMSDMVYPTEETIEAKKGGDTYMQLSVPLKDGTKTINLVYVNGTGYYTGTGKDATHQLATSASNPLTFNHTSGSSRVHEYFVVSWNSSTEGESTLVSATIEEDSNTVGMNITTLTNVITGENLCVDKRPGQTCTVGNEVLTINKIAYSSAERSVELNTSSSGGFDRLYTKEGLLIYLPVKSATGGGKGVINTSAYAQTWVLHMSEEDKDSNLNQKAFNVTFGVTGTDNDVTVSDIDTARSEYEIGDTDVYESYVQSDLATKILYDTSGTQDSAKIIYHGEQAYANVYLAAPAVTFSTGTGATLGTVTYYDNALTDAAKAKNLIVVGGSCVNIVAEQLLGGKLCTEAFTEATKFTASTGVGADQFLIKVFTNPYADNKIALLVAGYEAADTSNAVTYLTQETVATDVSATPIKKATTTWTDVA